MTMQTGGAPGVLVLWWWRRLARRRQVAAAALDMHDRFGSAAYGLARNTARRGRHTERRFWRQVAKRLHRSQAADARRPDPGAGPGERVIDAAIR